MLSARNRRRLQKRQTALPSGKPGLRSQDPQATEEPTQSAAAIVPFDSREPLLYEPRSHRGVIYRYLDCAEHAQAWIEGGVVPIFPAHSYLAEEQEGIRTPDEVRQRVVASTDPRAAAFMSQGLGNVTGSVRYINSRAYAGGSSYLLNGSIEQRFEDAYVLCFSASHTPEIMKGLKKSVCVEIDDPAALKDAIDRQIRSRSYSGLVDYTTGPDRSHFLKSEGARYMEEYRFVWRQSGTEVIEINLPPGVGRLVTFEGV